MPSSTLPAVATDGDDHTATPWPPRGWVAPRRISIDAGAVTLSALQYHGSRSGQSSVADSTVVLLHGWADSAWSMDCLAQALVAHHRVISLDMRGHGHSDRGPYHMVHLIGDVRGAFEALSLERAIVIGHSLGGQILSQFSGLYPELPRALVCAEGIGPPPHPLAASDPDEYERMLSRRSVERARSALQRRPLESVDVAAQRLLRSHPLLNPARAEFLAERNTVRDGDGLLWWRFDPNSRDWLNGHSQESAAARWRGIICPVLVVNGADSFDRYWQPRSPGPDEYDGPLTGPSLEQRLANFADVRYEEIPGAGHMVHYDTPDELNRVVVPFVDQVARS